MKNMFSILAVMLIAAMIVPSGAIMAFAAGVFGLSYLIPTGAGMVNATMPNNIWDALDAAILPRKTDKADVPTFLRSFFKKERVDSLNVLLRTKQKGKKVAIDTNIQSKSRLFKRQIGKADVVQPPLYSYFTALTQSDAYNGFSRLTSIDGNGSLETIRDFANVIKGDVDDMSDMIDRAIELQCAQLFDNGVISFTSNDSINFGRLVGSIASTTIAWGGATSTPIADLTTGVNWIRANTNNGSVEYHAIMGSNAFTNFITDANVLARQDKINLKLDELFPGGIAPSGGAYWGTLSLSNGIRLNIWSYDGTYEKQDGTVTRYVDADTVVIIPKQNEFVEVDAKVMLLPGTSNVGSYKGKTTRDYLDERDQSHLYFVEARPLAVTQEINEIYTLDTSVTQ